MATPASSEGAPKGRPAASEALPDPQRLVDVLHSGSPALLQVLLELARHPRFELTHGLVIGAIDEATDVEVDAIPDLATAPGVLEPSPDDTVHAEADGLKLRLSMLPNRRMELTANSLPNRFVKGFVLRAVRALQGAPEHAAVRRRLLALVATGELSDVEPLTSLHYRSNAVLERDPRYRRVLEAALALR